MKPEWNTFFFLLLWKKLDMMVFLYALYKWITYNFLKPDKLGK